jgi:serine/threonine protein phosphatase PrpC
MRLQVSVGQHSHRGRKEVNQDFHGYRSPSEPLLSSKGIAIAIADGISSSDVSQAASKSAVNSFLHDYFCTSEAWSVKKSAHCVMSAANSWLHAQTRQSPYRYERDRGYVCTLSAMVLKSTTAYIFHVGDARVYRIHANALEQLTQDHRCWVSQDKSYLSRALGIDHHLEVDYLAVEMMVGDVFLLATDGIYEHIDRECLVDAVVRANRDLNAAAQALVEAAYDAGSTDNLTVQIVRIDALPPPESHSLYFHYSDLPLPPALEAPTTFDGFNILRKLHASSRSHVYLATDSADQAKVAIKIPSTEFQNDPEYLERFILEDWVARRINSPHVLRPCLPSRRRNYLYLVSEHVEGRTLFQWMLDNPVPDLETVRNIIEQVAKGLRAFHRLEMLHQDLRPHNIMIDSAGTIKIIDFGSTAVAGITEGAGVFNQPRLLGTAQYTAPEYFLGEPGTTRSDLFSLGVITYQMLTGTLPYGTQVAKARTRSAQHKLKYKAALRDDREIPMWVDGALKKAVHPIPHKRYEALSEFLHDLRHPNEAFADKSRLPLAERNPVVFWQAVSLLLFCLVMVLLGR